jgi:hypothetical protein
MLAFEDKWLSMQKFEDATRRLLASKADESSLPAYDVVFMGGGDAVAGCNRWFEYKRRAEAYSLQLQAEFHDQTHNTLVLWARELQEEIATPSTFL